MYDSILSVVCFSHITETALHYSVYADDTVSYKPSYVETTSMMLWSLCFFSHITPHHTSPLPEGNRAVCSDCNYSVGIKVWCGLFDLVTGLFGDILETTKQLFWRMPCSHFNKEHGKHTACWRSLEIAAKEHSVLTDGDRDDSGVALLAKQTEVQEPEMWI